LYHKKAKFKSNEKDFNMKLDGNGKYILIAVVALIVLVLVVVSFMPSLGGFSSRETTRWNVSRYVPGKVSALSDQEAQALVSMPVDILKNKITFNGKSCQGVTFQTQTVATADYLLENWQITPEALGVQDKEIQVIKTNCDIPGYSEYVRLPNGDLIIAYDGVFFFLNPGVAQ